MPQLGGTELVILFAVFLLLFGARRLPELARGTGQALRIFRTETRHEGDELVPAVQGDATRNTGQPISVRHADGSEVTAC